ncbi:Zn-ribbon domain-containing OB-fold protein [Metallosphaera tengchongensis]|uniref:Zn-ribbon domain-containing OB-fold protein n=1 Tax=Metallosphaera tengchongensis TaxID=1532350 RepID=A0A6N0NXG3_9CREN|nr:Zn-ribbon domain-containing OB-fold protein [Metallosphaera tengchongensis]QKR00068.1 Zn-ribbon domain-containing OB-fold protein [Metallosphaera tengchongensis]
MSWDKTGRETDLLTWKDVMEVNSYVYTVGSDGENFLKGLKEGKILGRKCPKCGKVYVPPRMYCEECFVENGEYLELKEAYLETFTVVYYDSDGNRLEKPVTIGLIRFHGASGGLLAYLDGVPEIGRKVEIETYDIPLRVRVK